MYKYMTCYQYLIINFYSTAAAHTHTRTYIEQSTEHSYTGTTAYTTSVGRDEFTHKQTVVLVVVAVAVYKQNKKRTLLDALVSFESIFME